MRIMQSLRIVRRMPLNGSNRLLKKGSDRTTHVEGTVLDHKKRMRGEDLTGLPSFSTGG